MVGNSAKKLDNLDVRFVCNFISKKFLSLENRGLFYDLDVHIFTIHLVNQDKSTFCIFLI